MKTIPKTGQTFYINIPRQDIKDAIESGGVDGICPFSSEVDCINSASAWASSEEREWLVIECKITIRCIPNP